MTEWLIYILFWGVFAFLMTIKQYRQHKERQKEAASHTPADETGFEITTIKATVVDQACCVKTVGFKTPKTVKEFSVTFQTEAGEHLALHIPEEMYDGLTTGETGILSLVDGELYSFEPEDTNSPA